MMAGMHKFNRSAVSEFLKPMPQDEIEVIDRLILRSTNDISAPPGLSLKSLAVWRIESKSLSMDTENVRQKIINNLVNNGTYKVISREHLNELLTEQNLSLSGAIDSSNAAKIGSLIGVEGFLTGYLSKTKNRIDLSLRIINSTSGQIIWSSNQHEKI